MEKTTYGTTGLKNYLAVKKEQSGTFLSSLGLPAAKHWGQRQNQSTVWF